MEIKSPSQILSFRLIANAGVIILLFAVALVMMHSFIPLQELHQSCLYGDMIILGYVLAWGAHSLTSDPLNYYNPPIFHPSTNMLPGTDGLELPALFLSPVWALTHNPVLLMNLSVLLSHFFTLLGAYAAARLVLKSTRTISLIVSFVFAITSDRFWHATGHLNLIWSGILPLVFAGVWIVLELPSYKRIAFLALGIGASVYFSVYFFVLAGLTAVVALVCWCFSRWKLPDLRTGKFLAIAVVAAAFVAAPKIAVYHQASTRSSNVRNSLSQAATYSASRMGYLQPVASSQRYTSYWYILFTNDSDSDNKPEDGQFVGYVIVLLIVVELVRLAGCALRRQMGPLDRLSFVSVAIGGFVILCSFGPEYRLIGLSPYRFLYYSYLQFSGFYRVPARLAFLVQWLYALPIGVLGLRVSGQFTYFEKAISLLLMFLILFWEHMPMKRPAQFQWEKLQIFDNLDKLDPSGQQPYIFLSEDMSLAPALSTIHNWRPTANGWIGSPLGEDYDQRYYNFREFPSTGSLAWLAINNIPWVMTNRSEVAAKALSSEQLSLIETKQGVSLFKMVDPKGLANRHKLDHEALKQELITIRSKLPEKVSWPDGQLLKAGGGDGFHMEAGSARYGTKDHNNITTIFNLSAPLTPGAYDRVWIRYKLLDGTSDHQTRLYWQTSEAAMSEQRAVAGVTNSLGDAEWETTFVLNDRDWYLDSRLTRLRMDFYGFNALDPVLLEITQVQLLRDSELPELPLM